MINTNTTVDVLKTLLIGLFFIPTVVYVCVWMGTCAWHRAKQSVIKGGKQ